MITHLCIDFGIKNIGLAISEEGSLSTPYKSLYIKDGNYQELFDLINQIQPQNIVVGKPSFGPILPDLQKFIEKLNQLFPGLVSVFSEDHSTDFASNHPSVRNHRHTDHAIAASFTLQNFLDES